MLLTQPKASLSGTNAATLGVMLCQIHSQDQIHLFLHFHISHLSSMLTHFASYLFLICHRWQNILLDSILSLFIKAPSLTTYRMRRHWYKHKKFDRNLFSAICNLNFMISDITFSWPKIHGDAGCSWRAHHSWKKFVSNGSKMVTAG